MSYADTASKYHNFIVDAMAHHKGKILQKNEIIKVLVSEFPELELKQEWILPSDHCINHANKGACYCSKDRNAIFEKIGHGKYKVRQYLQKL